MRKVLLAILLCMVACSVFAQNSSSKWQSGTITLVEPHLATQDAPDVRRYDISVKVGKTIYVVLYTTSASSDTVKYRAGLDLLVMVGKDTITFNDLLGRQNKVPILRRETIQAQQ